MDDDDDQPTFPDQRKNRYDLNSKIMLTAIISLSIVVVIVTLLHIYARFVLRRQARRRAAMQQLRLAVTLPHTSTEPPKTGLHPSIIASLPIFVFRHSNTDTLGGGHTECAVCLSFLEDNEMARILPNCKHTFHAECIDKWLGSQSTCPICRTEAEPRLMPEPREGLSGSRVGAPPSAPPLEHGSSDLTGVEGTSDGGIQEQITTPLTGKINGGGSSSRLSSFRRMLSRDKSSRRINQQSGGQEDERQEDVERQ